MPVPALLHLPNYRFVALVERGRFPYPAQGLGMLSIPAHPAVLGKDIPETMEFAMLAQQMLPAELARRQIPDTHAASLSGGGYAS